MNRLAPWVLTTLLVLSAAPPAAALPRQRADWIRVDTAHFTLLGSAREPILKQVGTDLERLHAILALELDRPELSSPVVTTIFVFRNHASFTPYKPLRGGSPAAAVSGYFLPHPYGNFIAIDGDPTLDTTRLIYHEYLHYVLDSNFPHLPLWLNEGLAEYYSTFRIAKNEAWIGIAVDEHLAWLRGNDPIALAELLAVDRSSELYHEAGDKGAFYAQSWAIVHALFGSGGERRRQSSLFLDLIRSAGAAPALREAFAMTIDDLEQELRRFVQRRKLRFQSRPLAEVPASLELTSRPLPWHEVLYHLGRLLTASGPQRYAEAAEHFRAALEARPDHGPSYAGLALLEDLQDRPLEATASYQRAVELGPQDFLVLFLYGQNLLRPLTGRSFTPGELDAATRSRVDKARRAFRQSLELRGDFAEARAGLGATYLFEPEASEEGLSALEAARRQLPGRLDIAFNLVMLTAQAGRREQAHDLIEEILLPHAGPRQIESARDALLEADFRAAGELDRQEDLAGAIAVLEQSLARTRGDQRRQRLAERLAELRSVLERREARKVRRER